jgi:magnesium transporter
MIRILYGTENGACRTDLPIEELAAALQDQAGVIWVDLAGEPAPTSEAILLDTFGFHPLSVDDALNEIHVPKLDDWESYLYIVLRAVPDEPHQFDEAEIPELDVFLGENYIVTYHAGPISAVERIWEACRQDERLLKNGPDHLLYRIADELVVDYIGMIERLEEALGVIEDIVFVRPTPLMLQEIFTIKRGLLQLRRIVSPQREVFNKLARDDYPMIDPKDRIFFRDLYDHMIRVYELMESLREVITGTVETYLSLVNNRMNDIMKTLTVITTLFMPLAFITGFFGMNFFEPAVRLPAWTGLYSFEITLAFMILIPLFMFWWMRRRAWM